VNFAQALARLIFSREPVARWLENSRFVQDVAHRVNARGWINSALTRHPIRRRLPGSGVKYQIENFETLAVEREFFQNPDYLEIFRHNPPDTFIDLGCNSGLFPCLLAHAAGGKAPRGLCVDANPAQAQLAYRTMQLNGWKDVHVRCGLVGSSEEGAIDAEFFLHPTSLGSSAFAYADSDSGRKPDWKSIRVPALNVAAEWIDLFGKETRCSCLKIDIEGSEINFFRSESSFLRRVDSILLEWHLWTTTREEVVSFLDEHGFVLVNVLEEMPRHGVLYFRRR
jgi:FkbM family methyltransferase